jgi:proline dehydrogenase
VTNEAGLDEVVRQVVDSIRLAASEPAIKFSCVKVSGLCSESMMEKASAVLRQHPDLLDRFEADWRATDVAAVLGSKGADHLKAEEVLQLAAVLERLGRICAAAAASNLPVLIDAEQTWVQPWIDLCSMLMSLRHNHSRPVVYNTYQHYLKDAMKRLEADLARAQRSNIMLGAKLVRGAYMVSESARAEAGRYENPILPSIEDTHNSYNTGVQLLIKNIDRAALMVASHNKVRVFSASPQSITHSCHRSLSFWRLER